jgi:Mg2+ and Co2+ transporter CorA
MYLNLKFLHKFINELVEIGKQVKMFNEELTKNNISNNENREKIFRFERELVETKDLLKSLNSKLDSYIIETNDKFSDFETAITDIEKLIPNGSEINMNELSVSLLSNINFNENSIDSSIVDTES